MAQSGPVSYTHLVQDGALAADSRDAEPDVGLITRQRGLHVEYVPQEPRLPITSSVIEALRAGMRRHGQVLAELEALGHEIETSDGTKDVYKRQLSVVR